MSKPSKESGTNVKKQEQIAKDWFCRVQEKQRENINCVAKQVDNMFEELDNQWQIAKESDLGRMKSARWAAEAYFRDHPANLSRSSSLLTQQMLTSLSQVQHELEQQSRGMHFAATGAVANSISEYYGRLADELASWRRQEVERHRQEVLRQRNEHDRQVNAEGIATAWKSLLKKDIGTS